MIKKILLFIFIFQATHAEAISDSPESIEFKYFHIVDGEVASSKVDPKISSAAPDFKNFILNLVNVFPKIIQDENLKVKICSDLIACYPSQYQPSTNTLYIQPIRDLHDDSNLLAGKAIAAHEYTHRVFHQFATQNIPQFKALWQKYESNEMDESLKARFLNFLNFSYFPITELLADFCSSVYLGNPNAMIIAFGEYRGFKIDISKSNEYFFSATTIGNQGLVPNTHLMLVPFRNKIWINYTTSLEALKFSQNEKIIVLEKIFKDFLLINRKLYSKATERGLVREDLIYELNVLME